MKSKTVVDGDDTQHLVYKCPGCKHNHSVPTKRWNWNGSLESPTLSPSVLHFIEHENRRRETVCHYHIRNGRIEYCGDCQHELAGKTIELPNID